jgi:aspartyl-tRNA(Asn)/glutamyl-tRNA(Gln) amidotransferase subunit C
MEPLMAVSIDEVRRLARLARLELSEEQLERFAGDVGRILDHVRHLEAVDVEGVEPTSHGVVLPTKWRADVPTEEDVHEDLLKGAPARVGDAVSVPRVIE